MLNVKFTQDFGGTRQWTVTFVDFGIKAYDFTLEQSQTYWNLWGTR